MLILELSIKRDDGTTVVTMQADAMKPFKWSALLNGDIIQDGLALTEFTYDPDVRERK